MSMHSCGYVPSMVSVKDSENSVSDRMHKKAKS